MIGVFNLTRYILEERKTYKVGDLIEAKDLALTVYNFEDYVSNEPSSSCFPDGEEKCIAVEVGVKNIKESSQKGVYSSFSLWYEKKDESYYSSTPGQWYYFTPHGLFLEDELEEDALEARSIPILPGQEIKGTLIFKIPREASDLRLRWMPYSRAIPRFWIRLEK